MNNDPLLPYLAELIAEPEAAGVILTGGFGIRLKQSHLRAVRQSAGTRITLIDDFPEARATQDIDLMLSVSLWVESEKAIAFREMLVERLKYEMFTYNWQLRKPISEIDGRYAKLDLQSRSPLANEQVKVGNRPNKPAQVGYNMKTGISARETPEAFAIDDSPILLEFVHTGITHSLLVPHPYAWINLKVRAAYDWVLERRGDKEPKLTPNGDSVRLKHVYDVYALVAMMTPQEASEAAALAEKYWDHDEAIKTRDQARGLYGTADSMGVQAVRTYMRQSFGHDVAIDYDLFWNGLQLALNM